MNRELTTIEKQIREISEEKNPYSNNCNNKHLWSEGYRSAFNDLKELLEKAKVLVGYPATGISAATDLECEKWHETYDYYMNNIK